MTNSKDRSYSDRYSNHKEMSIIEKKLDEFLICRGFHYIYQVSLRDPRTDQFENYSFVVYKDLERTIPVCAIKADTNPKSTGEYTIDSNPGGYPAKIIIANSLDFEETLTQILQCLNISYEGWIQDIIDSLPKEFPYYKYSDERLLKDWNSLCNKGLSSPRSRIGDFIIKNFHPSIYRCRCGRNPSPLEAWNTPELVDRCVKNRFIYSRRLDAHAIIDGFNINKSAPKVSVFSAILAKNLIEKYLSEYETIFDPFSGFSGRLLGALASNKRYIGQDLNKTTVKESNDIIRFLNAQDVAQVISKDIFDSAGKYECLLTCPPYGALEDWGNKDQKIKSCDEWVGECLKRFDCKRYVFVVDGTSKYKDNIAEVLKNKSHFGSNNEYVLVMDSKTKRFQTCFL